MYKFLKVEGIDNVNTPLFETLQEQKAWFTSKVQVIIDDIFPPYYTNVISVSSDELDFSSDINYVELVFNGKSYYYFIESTSYVNEDVIDITLRMDTIQTYMFDIEYTNARLRRRTIKRWNSDGTINRDYIRENFGNDVFIDKTYRDYTLEKQFDGFNGWIIGKMIKETWTITDNTVVDATFASDNQLLYNDGSKIVILPAMVFNTENRNLSNVKIDWITSTGEEKRETWNFIQTLDYIHKLQEEPNLVDLYYLPHQVFRGIAFRYDEETNTIQIYYNPSQFTFKNDIEGYRFLTTKQFESSKEAKLINLDFEQNTLTPRNFNYKFCPQLIDENYLNVMYGERMAQTTYPLSKMLSTTLYGRGSCDVLSGYRNYWLVENLNDYDKYLTLKTINTKESYIMVNDIWKQYIANNKGSVFIGNTLAMLKSGFDAWTFKTYKTPKGAPKRIFKAKGGLTSYGTKFKDTLLDNDMHSTIENNINKIFAPETLTQGNEFSNDVLSNNMQEILIIREVSNIEYVATIYESIGYRVDTFVIGNPIHQDRTYYNYVECEDMDIRLTCLSVENALDDIKERYNQGIRYFNMTAMTSVGLQLGDICVYDNIEL